MERRQTCHIIANNTSICLVRFVLDKNKIISMKKLLLILLALILVSHTTPAQSKKKRKKAIESVVRYAESYKGTPYKYGGTSKSGIDCSALMQNAFASVGYEIPRTSENQSDFGKKVRWGSARPGDIVFFRFKEKRKKWYHSGLINRVDGNKIYFIHASTSRGVIESDLSDEYYKKNIKVFRRVIK